MDGTDCFTLIRAIKKINEIDGGYVLITGGSEKTLSLPFVGFVSIESYQHVSRKLKQMLSNTHTKHKNPLMAHSFLSLPVIPHLRLTDKGLVDVDRCEFVDLVTS
ncbi:MAG: adenine deaminase C-terminal domain-containing protein [Candidatus Heimdallarchaeota archaeon]